MTDNDNWDGNTSPGFMKWIIVLTSMASIATVPVMLSSLQPESPLKPFMWLFPLYIAGSAVCAWKCMRNRIELSYILLALMLIATAALTYTVTRL